MAAIRRSGRYVVILSGPSINVYEIGKPGRLVYSATSAAVSANENKPGDKSEEGGTDRILAAGFSCCGAYFVTCDDRKKLHLWNVRDAWELISTRSIPRRSTSLTFTKDGEAVIVGDKSGDAHRFSLTNPQEECETILGHVSMLLDVAIINDDKYLVTCDRDEKIRVSCYPETFVIHSFCLGHTEFVTKIKYLQSLDLLVSTSGDGSLRVWDYKEGNQLACRTCDADFSLAENEHLDIHCLSVIESQNIIIISCHRTKKIIAYRLTSGNQPELTLLHKLDLEAEIMDMCVDTEDRLWVLQKSESSALCVYHLTEDEAQFIPDVSEERVALCQEVNSDWKMFKDSLEVECIFSLLHRPKTDKAKMAYYERKEQRLEEQKSKRKNKEGQQAETSNGQVENKISEPSVLPPSDLKDNKDSGQMEPPDKKIKT